jgi:hypothetical protein
MSVYKKLWQTLPLILTTSKKDKEDTVMAAVPDNYVSVLSIAYRTPYLPWELSVRNTLKRLESKGYVTSANWIYHTEDIMGRQVVKEYLCYKRTEKNYPFPLDAESELT